MPSTATPNHQPTRSGRDRRAGRERRRVERRKRMVSVRVDRRTGRDRRARQDRRTRADRRRSFATRRPGAATGVTDAPPRLTARDRTKARMLPDDFMQAGGDTAARLSRMIRKKWANAPRQVRAGLVDGLAPILDPLTSGGLVSESVRDACEEVVATWLAPFRRG